MSPLRNRSKRVALIVAVGLGLAAAGFGAYEVRVMGLDRQAIADREKGRTALTSGDHAAALDGLGRYLQRFADRGATAEDYVLYARARVLVELPNGKHFLTAIANLRKALLLDPGCADARKDLLELYLNTGYTTESLELIDKMLVAAPNDLPLLRKRFDVLMELHRYKEAVESAKLFNEHTPDDLEGFFRTLGALAAAEMPTDEIDAWTDAVLSSHAQDPRFELLRVSALSRRGDAAAERNVGALLDHVLAATKESKDPQFVVILVAELDAAGRFDDSMQVIERVESDENADLHRELLRRLLYAGRISDLLQRTDRPNGQSSLADPEVVALHALALIVSHRAAEAEPLRADLAARGDAVGKAWSAFVDQAAGGEKANSNGARAALAEAVKALPASALMRQALGDATAALGEPERAVENWTAASRRAPSWATPLREIAQTLVRTPGSEAQAVASARAAYARAPTDPETFKVLVEALAAGGGGQDPGLRDRLLGAIDRLETESPETADALLPVKVKLLLQTDRAGAERRIHQVLDGKTRPSEATLLRLAQIAQRTDASLATKLLDLSETIHGVTPHLALARAVAAADGGGAEAGLSVLEKLRARAPASTPLLDWDLVQANYLDTVGRPDAAKTWVTLAAAHPDVLAVQLGALASAAVWKDREAVAVLVERVHGLTGDEGTTWRIANARLQLSAPGVDSATISATAQVLASVCRDAPKSLSAHVLLAQAQEKLGNLAGAEEQLQLASEIAKDNSWIALELARLALRQGHGDVARRQLERALEPGASELGPEMTTRAAYLLAMQGDVGRGADLLEPVASSGRSRRDGILLLARLYARLGKFARAIDLCQGLLDPPDAEVLELVANLHASNGAPGEAASALSRLDRCELSPGARELIRARHAARWAKPQDAKDCFRKAILAAPTGSEAWTALLAYAISIGDTATVSSILDDPKASNVEPVQYLTSIRALAVPATADARLRPLVLDAVDDKPARPALAEALGTMSRDWSDPAKRVEAGRIVRGLADKHLDVLSLQLLAADAVAQLGDLRAGCEIARRAMMQSPDSEAAAWQAAELLARSGRWIEALDAGLAWRDRAAHDDLAPELFVARAMMRTGRVADAAAAMESKLPIARAKPAENEEFLLTYAVALTLTGRAPETTDLLAELVRTSDRWRVLPLDVPPFGLGSGDGAVAWLKICERNVPASDVDARIHLARAWVAAWQTYQSAELLSCATRELDAITSAPSAPAEAWHVAATLALQRGDLKAARRGYLAALQRDPAYAESHNNLAMLLADAGEWQAAVEHGRSAINSAPRSAEYRDTLAYALRKGRKFDEAKASLQEAIRIEPANLAWQVSLAETLSESGSVADLAEQARVVARVEDLASKGAEVPPPIRQRIDALRRKPD